MTALIYVMFKLKLLSFKGFFRLIAAIWQDGINLMALLRIAERSYGDKIAITDEQETLTYRQLMSQSERLSCVLTEHYGLGPGKKAGILCRNHAAMAKTIFAVSAAGADLYLLNAEMSAAQFGQLAEEHRFDVIIHDEDAASLIAMSSSHRESIFSYHDSLPAIHTLAQEQIPLRPKRRRMSAGRLMLLTGGTTGKAKRVPHKPSLFHYLPPFAAMLSRMRLAEYRTAYIATPIYHGYGIGVLLLGVALGQKVVLTRKFDAANACGLIRQHQVEFVSVVPLMVHKMLRANAEGLKPVACIASGGAELNPKLVEEVSSALGDVLYNLYGTSEGGLMAIATPQDLKDSPNTIGRRIRGVPLSVLDAGKKIARTGEIGQLCLRGKRRGAGRWIETGDLGFVNERGYYFLCGRTDDRIVSAGENVYPIEVERMLCLHPAIEDVAVVGIPDEMFGQRLKAVVQLYPGAELSEAELMAWLRPRAARFQMPKEVVFTEQIIYTHAGKRDKKQLKTY
ncbi:AMP-dependent synthetase [Paenibacillus nanensis]|uniref:AMP-dependent synthetase n=1 Tax=Paenibacillus nanensis TaxID=393251 RepID=A0A3A1V2H6_9BACL|nr:AMP-binding protein [Paenibacillus nanensis]RIX53936.1 AMP-dependent synthetase [Paenibacillus nanensis]